MSDSKFRHFNPEAVREMLEKELQIEIPIWLYDNIFNEIDYMIDQDREANQETEDDIKEAAYVKGYKRGYSAGFDANKEELTEILKEAMTMLESSTLKDVDESDARQAMCDQDDEEYAAKKAEERRKEQEKRLAEQASAEAKWAKELNDARAERVAEDLNRIRADKGTNAFQPDYSTSHLTSNSAGFPLVAKKRGRPAGSKNKVKN